MLNIFGAIPDAVMSRKKIYLLHILLAAAKKAITLSSLKKKRPSNLDTWQSVVKGIYTMEKITFMLRLQNAQFTDKWFPLARSDG